MLPKAFPMKKKKHNKSSKRKYEHCDQHADFWNVVRQQEIMRDLHGCWISGNKKKPGIHCR
jgi:hypothetical protein